MMHALIIEDDWLIALELQIHMLSLGFASSDLAVGEAQAVALAARGRGSLVGSLVTKSPKVAAQVVPQLAALHGRILVLDREAAVESTGHGSPLPMLKHGGPGRARSGFRATSRVHPLKKGGTAIWYGTMDQQSGITILTPLDKTSK